MKKKTLLRLYEDACNEMAAAERERDALLADADDQVEGNANEVQRVHNLHRSLLDRYDNLTLALAFLLGDDRKNRLVDLAEAGAWGFEDVKLSRKSRKDLDRILALFDASGEPDCGQDRQLQGKTVVYDPNGPEPDETVRVLFDGSDPDEHSKRYLVRSSDGWSWEYKPGEPAHGMGYSWSYAGQAWGPLVDVTSEVA